LLYLNSVSWKALEKHITAITAFINPGDITFDYAFMATKHAKETHLIPLPPHGFGSDSDKLEILRNIKLFLMGTKGDKIGLPPLYTRPDDIDAVESFLRQLHEGNVGRDMFRLYSVCKLFHELRNTSMSVHGGSDTCDDLSAGRILHLKLS
jgi:hypothetical protein